METKHTPQLPDLESAPTNDTAALTCYALDWRELSHEFKAERDKLAAINAELVAALERILYAHDNHGNGAAMGDAILCQQYAAQARAALAKSK